MAAGIVLEGGHWRVMGRRARAHPLSVHCPVPARVSPGRLRERAHVGHLQSTTSVTGNTRACLLQLGVSGQRHGRPLAPSRTPSPPPPCCSCPCSMLPSMLGPGAWGVCTRPTPAASRPHKRCGLRVWEWERQQQQTGRCGPSTRTYSALCSRLFVLMFPRSTGGHCRTFLAAGPTSMFGNPLAQVC